MDEGNSRRVLSYCKPIMYKLSRPRVLCRVNAMCEKV
jgi:hypothetical protein